MKFIDFEETLDRDLGKVGIPKRDAFESCVDKAVHANFEGGFDVKDGRPERANARES